jgi:ribosomal-protein-alanine N-acetyltransferase
MMFEREPILQGQRLSVRPFIASDVGSAYLGWLNDPEVTRFSNQRFKRHDAISALTYLRTFDGSDNRFLLVCDTESARPIGTLTVYASRPHGTADIGIMIGDRMSWGKGLGQEAWNLVLGWLLEASAIRKVTAGTAALNIGMVRLMERSGMRHEATRRQQEIIEGRPVDLVYFARFKS